MEKRSEYGKNNYRNKEAEELNLLSSTRRHLLQTAGAITGLVLGSTTAGSKGSEKNSQPAVDSSREGETRPKQEEGTVGASATVDPSEIPNKPKRNYSVPRDTIPPSIKRKTRERYQNGAPQPDHVVKAPPRNEDRVDNNGDSE